MIYKFYSAEDGISLEIEHFNQLNQSISLPDTIAFSLINNDEDNLHIHLTKKDVFKLIGALHLLHKEMM